MSGADPLSLFLPPVAHWFRAALGEPTPAQAQAWPAIAAGKHTLVLAPTGSGKTLAAFLACLDGLWRQPELPRGVRVLYISPLKALNNDIFRNLQVPLEGVTAAARDMGLSLPALEVAVRTGDTPAAERQRMLRKPPHILITTPESLHLLLTSRARETLRIGDALHRGRDSCPLPQQTRRFHGPAAGASRGIDGQGCRPHRPVGDPAPAGGSRSLPGRRGLTT